MTFMGADTDQLRDLGTRMRLGMSRLQTQRDEIMRAVMTVSWEGPDAEDFRSRIGTEVLPKMQASSEDLSGRGAELFDHAREQDDASDPRDIWQKLNDLLKWPAEIARTIRDIAKLVTDIPKFIKYMKDGKVGLQTLRDLLDLRKTFPELAKLEYKNIMKEWDEVLNGKGWEKLGNFIPQKLSKYLGINLPGKEWAGKALSHLDEITDATKPWIKVGSKSLGKILPGLDIGLGIHQIATGNNYEKVSGGLSVASGALVLSAPLFGPAAPIVAGVGVGLGVVSAGMDIGKVAYDHIPAFKNAVDGGLKAVGDGFSKVKGWFS